MLGIKNSNLTANSNFHILNGLQYYLLLIYLDLYNPNNPIQPSIALTDEI